MSGFLVEEGEVWKMFKVFFSNLGRKCIITEERFELELPTSCAMLATARPSCSPSPAVYSPSSFLFHLSILVPTLFYILVFSLFVPVKLLGRGGVGGRVWAAGCSCSCRLAADFCSGTDRGILVHGPGCTFTYLGTD